MAMLLLFGSFVIALTIARIVRFATGVWVPGWIGGLSLLGLFLIFFLVAVTPLAPGWWESAFFVLVGLHVGAFISLARLKLEGAWWQIWR